MSFGPQFNYRTRRPTGGWGSARIGRPKGSKNKHSKDDNTKVEQPPRINRADEIVLRAWFEEHPNAWEGWPSTRANEPQYQQLRLSRLVRHGCLFLNRRNIVASADALIGDIRDERRMGYTKRVHQEMGSTEKLAGYLVVDPPGKGA